MLCKQSREKILKYKFIESKDQLKDICEGLLKEKMIGVDLEADSMHCFKEKICLIQIASSTEAFLIDPFEFDDLSCFIDVLENHDVIKILHGSDFDVRSLDRDYNAKINNLFDTEIASRFLGVKERGLAALLKKNFDLDVDKKFQKEDWSKRPLQQDMIEYSVGDVAYLTKLYDIIKARLDEHKRYSWAKEEFELQASVRYESNHANPLFTKFKGAGKMDNRSLAALENLLQVRIKIAEQKDRPLYKVLSNASLMTMAYEKPVTVKNILKDRMLSKRQADMYGNLCVDAIVDAINLEHKDLPSYPKTRRPRRDPKVIERIDRLKKMREKLSISMGIEPGFLLNNAIIGSIAFKNPKDLEELLDVDQIRHWQVEAIGESILASLGHARL
jgi:ribonuclease D